MPDLQECGDLIDRRLALGFWHFAHLQGEGDVLSHRHIRIQRIALENHGDVAGVRCFPRDVPGVQMQTAGAGLFQTGHDIHQRAFAAA